MNMAVGSFGPDQHAAHRAIRVEQAAARRGRRRAGADRGLGHGLPVFPAAGAAGLVIRHQDFIGQDGQAVDAAGNDLARDDAGQRLLGAAAGAEQRRQIGSRSGICHRPGRRCRRSLGRHALWLTIRWWQLAGADRLRQMQAGIAAEYAPAGLGWPRCERRRCGRRRARAVVASALAARRRDRTPSGPARGESGRGKAGSSGSGSRAAMRARVRRQPRQRDRLRVSARGGDCLGIGAARLRDWARRRAEPQGSCGR